MLRFPVADEAALLGKFVDEDAGAGPVSVVIWTTTPWTLPANQAVALHPDLTYVLAQVENDGREERVVLVEDLLDQSMRRYGIGEYCILGKAAGSTLKGGRCAAI